MNAKAKMICLSAILVTGLAFLVYSQSVTAQAGASSGPVGVCDIHKAFAEYDKIINARTKLSADQSAIQQQINTANQDLKNMTEELKLSGLLPDSPEFEKKRAALLKKSVETKNFAEISQSELGRRDFLLREMGYQDIYKAVGKVAAKRNLSLVLSKEDLNMPSKKFEDLMSNIFYRRHVIYADNSIDITAEVTEQLNTDYGLGN